MSMSRGAGLNRWRVAGWGVAALLLLLPLVAMRFTQEVNWTLSDFLFAALLLGGVGTGLELAVRWAPNRPFVAGAGILLLTALLLVWINGAVGIIGDEDNDLNLLYGVIILMVFGGAVGAGFTARGMARASMLGAAAMVPMAVIAVREGASEPPGAFGLVLLNGFFLLLFLAAARLFRRSAQVETMNS